MSDLSVQWCKTCGSPYYACPCEEDVAEIVDAPITWLLKGEKIPADHPFRLERELHGEPMYGEEPDGEDPKA